MWSSRLFWKVFLVCVSLALISTVVFGTLLTRWHENEFNRQIEERLLATAVLIGSALEMQDLELRPEPLHTYLNRLGKRTKTRLTIIDADGRVLGDSFQPNVRDVEAMENHRGRPEIRDALETGSGFAKRFSKTAAEELFYSAVTMSRNGNVFGVARSSISVASSRPDLLRRLVLLFVSLVGVALLVSYFSVSRIVGPITRLKAAAEQIAGGDYACQIRVSDRDEVGALANALNGMKDQLVGRIAEYRNRGDQIETVLGSMVEGVVAVDKETKIIFANRAAGKMLGFGAVDQSVGKPLLNVFRNDNLNQVIRKAKEDRVPVSCTIESKSRSNRIFDVQSTPLPGDPCPGVVVVLQDTTEIRRLERLRHDFVANVSHELKTPLSSIKAYAETLREGAINDPKNNVAFVERIEEQANRLHQLIMDLLSLARIESSQQTFDIADVRIQEIVLTCIHNQQANAEAKRIRLKANPPAANLVVRIDDEALRQILDNLIDNALKYTPENGQVTVSWRQENDQVKLEVTDTGIGIAESDHDRLFERFFRVDKARSRELGGTGLGLSIVKHLAQFFGGRVGVQSKLKEGSTFWVLLPLNGGQVTGTRVAKD